MLRKRFMQSITQRVIQAVLEYSEIILNKLFMNLLMS